MPIDQEFAEAFFGPQIRFQEGVEERLEKMHRETYLKLKALTGEVLEFAEGIDSRKMSSRLTSLVYQVRALKLEDLEQMYGEDR